MIGHTPGPWDDLLKAAEALIYRYDNPDRKPYPALRTFGSLVEDLRTAIAKVKE